MIGSLHGTLAHREVKRDGTAAIIVDVHGVGYELTVSSRHYRDLPARAHEIDLSVHTHMREGALTLYGFSSRDERSLFELLLSAHGVGPSMALGILGAMSSVELVRAVSTNDVKALTALPGVGLKTAQRLILELAQKLDTITPDLHIHGDEQNDDRGNRVEVSEALAALGYGSEEIRAVMREINEATSIDELLRSALTQLAPRR
jgi:Holliday junction DNA helicase RuvA